MLGLRKAGGIAAVLEAATFLFGFALYATLLAPADYGSLAIDPVDNVEFLSDHQALLYLWYFVIYVVFGIALVVLTLALHDLLKPDAPTLAPLGAAFGLIWAGLVIASGMVANVGADVVIRLYEDDPERAGTTWLALTFVVDGLGGGNEVVGGVWILLVCWAARASGALPRALAYLGVLAGLAGILSAIPVLAEILGAIFGLALIVWFMWLGIVLMRAARPALRAMA